MSMQISVDPAGLTQEQREAVAGFILAYPAKCAGTCGNKSHTVDLEVRVDTTKAVAAVDALAAHTHAAGLPGTVTQALDPEIAQLVKEDGEFQASVAFGGPQPDPMAAAAFGGAQTPLPHGATAAPFTAVAVPFSTAPADTTGTTSTATSTAPVPPAPMPANVAPIAAQATANPAPAVDVDKDGLPWDGRIHVESKAKNADGRWRGKRNLDAAFKGQVEAELRQVMGAPAAPLAPAHSPAQQAAPVPGSQPWPFPATGQEVQTIAPVPPAPSAVPTPPVAGAAPSIPAAPNAAPAGEVPQDARQQFVGLVGRASAAIQAGKVTQAEVTQICAAAGVPTLPLLANRLDLVAHVAGQVDALIASRQQ